jgi:hypothetical protein
MGLSVDLRQRVVEAVLEGGLSRNAAGIMNQNPSDSGIPGDSVCSETALMQVREHASN